MTDIYDALDKVSEIAADLMCDMEQIKPEACGLEPRAGYRLYINDECIGIDKDNDRMLQYYGGFEYVDKEYRKELGDYVFYLAEDDRVSGHISMWRGDEEEDEDEC